MTDTPSPAVALIAEPGQASEHLRQALQARGARIVHEVPAEQLRPQALIDAGVEVVIVNLDAAVEAHLDAIYDQLDDARYRVVFNEAEVSRQLSGWEQARWARHLAAKLLGIGDVDPPRPPEARGIALPVSSAAIAEHETAVGIGDGVEREDHDEAAGFALDEPFPVAVEDAREPATWPPVDEASSDPVPDGDAPLGEAAAWSAEPDLDELGETQRRFSVDASISIDDGALDDWPSPAVAQGMPAADTPRIEDAAESIAAEPDDASGETPPPSSPAVEWTLEAMASAEHGEGGDAQTSADAPVSRTIGEPATPGVTVPDWGLVDLDGSADEGGDTSARPAQPDPIEFGIEKQSAAEFLAPVSEQGPDAAAIEPGLGLELISMEEAVAPQMARLDEAAGEGGAYEMILEERRSVRRVLALGAAEDGAATLQAFIAGLPEAPDFVTLVFQHHHEDVASELRQALAVATPLRVRSAFDGMVLQAGEVVLMPVRRGLGIERGTRIELSELSAERACEPSIDEGFSSVAAAFGDEALAVLFAGQGRDGIAGAQAIHDRGGKVWVERVADAGDSPMVAGVREEGLADHAGEVAELLAALPRAWR